MQAHSDKPAADPRQRHRTKRPGIYYRIGADGTKRYSVHYRDSAGKSRSKMVVGGFREAQAILDNLRDRMRRGERILPSRVTLGEYAETWLEGQSQLRPRTRQSYRWALDKHLLPRFRHRRLSSLTEDDATELIASMRMKGYAGATIQNALMPLGRILAHAARRGHIPANPLDRLERGERPRKSRGEMRCLDRDEIAALLDATGDPGMRTLLALSISTGLRQGETLGLRWDDLDLAASRLRVRYQLGRDGTLAEPKTPQARRDVDLAPSVVVMLREHKLRSLRSGSTDYVFASADDRPSHWRLNRALHSAARKAGIGSYVEHAGGKKRWHAGIRWHDLRHTAASLLIADGLNVVYVSRQLGHSNASITLNVYGHLFDRETHAERARSAMEAALGNTWAKSAGQQEENGATDQVAEVAQLGGMLSGQS